MLNHRAFLNGMREYATLFCSFQNVKSSHHPSTFHIIQVPYVAANLSVAILALMSTAVVPQDLCAGGLYIHSNCTQSMREVMPGYGGEESLSASFQ